MGGRDPGTKYLDHHSLFPQVHLPRKQPELELTCSFGKWCANSDLTSSTAVPPAVLVLSFKVCYKLLRLLQIYLLNIVFKYVLPPDCHSFGTVGPLNLLTLLGLS